MKQRAIVIVLAIGVIIGITFLQLRKPVTLPRIALVGGAEFRVFKVTYTPHASESWEHNLESAPQALFWLRNLLPASIRLKVPEPDRGIGWHGSNYPALSIWWARINPASHLPELGPSGEVVMTLDSGEQVIFDGSEAVDPGYRQIFIQDPPTHSKRLTFLVPVEDESVSFTIENPAFRQ